MKSLINSLAGKSIAVCLLAIVGSLSYFSLDEEVAAKVIDFPTVATTLPMQTGMAVVTCYSGLGGPTTTDPPNSDPSGFVLAIMDIRDPDGSGAPAAPDNWATPSAMAFHDPDWTAANLGELFGVALTEGAAPDIFVAAFGVIPGASGAITGGVDIVPGAGGNGGDLYRIDGTTGDITRLVGLPSTVYTYSSLNGTAGNENYAGLGNISYDADHDVVYAANLDDGMIYVVNATTGAVISTFDHGTQGLTGGATIADIPAQIYTPFERMVFGLQYNSRDGRLYYGVGVMGQVWSLAINPDGSIDAGSAMLEVTSPTAQPVQDISFNADATRMLLSHFTFDALSNNSYSTVITSTSTGATGQTGEPIPVREAHMSPVQQYEFNCGAWGFDNTFAVGLFSPQQNSSGGSDYGFNNYDDDPSFDEDAVVLMGDALQFQFGNGSNPGTGIYGLQISPIDGNTPGFSGNSYFIDLDGITENPNTQGSLVDYDKFLLGDVDVFAPPKPLVCDLDLAYVLTCDDLNETYSFTVTPSLTGGTNFCLDGSAGTGSGNATGNIYGTTLNFGPYPQGGGGVTLTVTDETDATCFEVLSVDPADCPDPNTGGGTNCDIEATATPGSCFAGLYNLTGTVTFIDPPSTGTATVSVDGETFVFNAPFPINSPQSYTIPELDGDGDNLTVTVQYSDGPDCGVQIIPITAPNCGPPTVTTVDSCGVTLANLTIDCQDGDDFTLSFDVEFANSIDSNMMIEVLLGGQPVTGSPFAAGIDTAVITVSNFLVEDPAFGVPLEARFVGNGDGCEDRKVLEFIACTDACQGVAGEVGGGAFEDANNDGVRDPAVDAPLRNALVRVYDCDEQLVCEVYTDSAGNWSCGGLTATDTFRVEFTTPLQPELTEAFAGPDNGTDVQFVVADGSCPASYGAAPPNLLCDAATFQSVTTCFNIGDPLDGSFTNDPAVIGNFLDDRDPSPFVPRADQRQDPNDSIYTSIEDVGSVYGLAITDRNEIFVAAYAKRFAGFGPGDVGREGSTGAIYRIVDGVTEVLIDLDPNSSSNPDPARFSTGANPHPNTTTDWETCDPMWHEAGRLGWGDIDLNAAQDRLYAMNMFDQSLYVIDTAGAVISRNPIPGVAGGPAFGGCTGVAEDLRPMATAFNPENGLVYIGVVCTGASVFNGGLFDATPRQQLEGYVFTFDPASGSYSPTPVLTFPLSPGQGYTPNAAAKRYEAWQPTDFDPSAVSPANEFVNGLARPIISDLGFDGDDLLIGIRNVQHDRLAGLVGTNYSDGDGNCTTVEQVTGIGRGAKGRLLRACATGGGPLTIEQNGVCGTQTGYGSEDNGGATPYVTFYEMTVTHEDGDYAGGFAIDPGTGQVISTGTPGTNSGGIFYVPLGAPHSPEGARQPGVSQEAFEYTQVYAFDFADNNSGRTFAKGSGLGDLELLCTAEPLTQIGNYVWEDTDADGMQDACEPPLSGVTVKLYGKPTAPATAPELLATTVTDATGNYYFAGRGIDAATWEAGVTHDTIDSDSTYFIAFCGDGGFDADNDILMLNGMVFCPSPNDATDPNGSDDRNDSDITVLDIDGEMLPAYCVESDDLEPGTNHTFDAGFKPLPYDLALRKVLSADADQPTGQSVGFAPGDRVAFDIEVINQGFGTAYGVVIGDSIPAGMSFVSVAAANGGISNGMTMFMVTDNGTVPQSFTIDSLVGRDTAILTVILEIEPLATSQAARPLINYAEIQAFDDDMDPNNPPPVDEDSTPDDDFGNDLGGVPGGPSDNVTDSIAPFDEDDADPARVPIFDLALRKAISPADLDPNGVYMDGDTIEFFIDVCNQGTDSVTNVVVKDYIPCGLDANFGIPNAMDPTDLNQAWVISGPDGGNSSVNDSVFYSFTGSIPPDSCARVSLFLRIRFNSPTTGPCAGKTAVEQLEFRVNRAEIRQFEDTDGNRPPDFDSTPDGIRDNDAGGVPDDVSDNVLDSIPPFDEDDADPASLNAFDVAIFKVVDTVATPGPYTVGDVVKYDIGVISQGNIDAQSLVVADLLPPGLSFDPTLGDNATQGTGGWTAAGADAVTLSLEDFPVGGTSQATLGFFDTAVVSIWLRVETPGADPVVSYTNLAEISSGVFLNPTNGNPVTATSDSDSPLSLGRGNDTGGGVNSDDDNETLDAEPGEDIDSQDPALIEVLTSVLVGDTTFIDVNENGIQDTGDEALPNVMVTIVDAQTGDPVTTDLFGMPYNATRFTDEDGSYRFDSLASGDYRVVFDISTAPNGDLYDYTVANAGTNDSLDSDVMPTMPMDDVGSSDATGTIPPGDSVLTLDAGVVCAVRVEVAEPFTICATRTIDLTQGARVTPTRLGGVWTVADPDAGEFLNANGEVIATGPFELGTAVSFRPSRAAVMRGAVTLTLTSGDPGMLTTASICAPVSASVTVEVLKVDCGSFFSNGVPGAGQ